MSAEKQKTSNAAPFPPPVWLNQAVEHRLVSQTEMAQWLVDAAQQDDPANWLQERVSLHPRFSELRALIASQTPDNAIRPTTYDGDGKDSTLGSQNPYVGPLDSPSGCSLNDATMVGGGIPRPGNSRVENHPQFDGIPDLSKQRSHSQISAAGQSDRSNEPPESRTNSSRVSHRSFNASGTNNWRQRTRELRSGFDRYQIRQEIGRGGCGVVSTAFDTQVQRLVVIKQIIAEATNSETATRFLNEAQITGQLSHPGIVPVYEMGQDRDGMPFYVMKHLDGKTLAEEIASFRQVQVGPESRSGLHRLLERFGDVCQTLAYAHNCGVIHRDLKPANIMIGEFGETIVLDWGLARHIEDSNSKQSAIQEQTVRVNQAEEGQQQLPSEIDSLAAESGSDPSRSDTDSNSLTQHGSVLGTAAYMSPEQARGANSALDQRTDVFSLGVILYEILSGKSPFRGDTLANTIENVRSCSYRPLRRVNRRVPRSLAAICQKAMSADPGDRYSDAGQLADDLQRYQAGQPVFAYQERWYEKLDRIADRHRTFFRSVFAAAIVLALATSISTGVVTRAHLAEQEAHKLAVDAQHTAEQSLEQEQLAHQVAVRQLETARQAADNWLIQISGDLQFYPGLQPIRSSLFQQGHEHYQRLIQEGEKALATHNDRIADQHWRQQCRLEISQNRIRVADLYQLQGDSQSAYSAFEAACAELDDLKETGNNALMSSEFLADVQLQHANAILGLAISGADEKSIDWTIRTEEKLLELLAENPGNHEVRNALVRARLIRARLMQTRLETSLKHDSKSNIEANDGIQCLQSALADVEVLIQAAPSEGNNRLKENVLRDLAQSCYNGRRYEQAEQYFGALLRYYNQLPEEYQYRPDIMEAKCWTGSYIAGCCMKSGRSREAVLHYEDALGELDRAWETLYGESFYRENQSAIEFNQSLLLSAMGRDAEAIESTKSAMAQLRWVIQSTEPTADRIQRMARIYLQLTELLAPEDWELARQWDQQTQVLLRHLSEDQANTSLVDQMSLQSKVLHLENFIRKNLWQEAENALIEIDDQPESDRGIDSILMRLEFARLQLAEQNERPTDQLLTEFVQCYATAKAIQAIDSDVSCANVVAMVAGRKAVSTEINSQLYDYSHQLVEHYPASEAAWTAFTVSALLCEETSEAKKGLERIKMNRIDPRPIHLWLESVILPKADSTNSKSANDLSSAAEGEGYGLWLPAIEVLEGRRTANRMEAK